MRILLFTGHRIDAPDRESSRFPARAEGRARRMIREAVEAELAASRGGAGQVGEAPVRGICGAASGGDILFLEVCRDLRVPCEIRLAIPREAYVRASVADAGPDWIARFDRLLAELPVRVLGADAGPSPEHRGAQEGEGSPVSIWQRSNLWMLAEALEAAPDAAHLTLIALWDGAAGDGPGGTEHMLEIARERGARTVVLDACELLGAA